MYFGYLVPFIGGLFGNLLATVDLRGIDFVLPGLFIVVFLEMLFNAKITKLRLWCSWCSYSTSHALVGWKIPFMLLSMSCMLVVCYIRTNGEVYILTSLEMVITVAIVVAGTLLTRFGAFPCIPLREKGARLCTLFRKGIARCRYGYARCIYLLRKPLF